MLDHGLRRGQTGFNSGSQGDILSPYAQWEDIQNILMVMGDKPDEVHNNGKYNVESYNQNNDTYATCQVDGMNGFNNTPATLKLEKVFAHIVPKHSSVYKVYLRLDRHCTGDNGGMPDVGIEKIKFNLGNGQSVDWIANKDDPNAKFDDNHLYLDEKNTDWYTIFTIDFFKDFYGKIPSISTRANDFSAEIFFTSNKSDYGGTLYIDSALIGFEFTPPTTGSITSGDNKDSEKNVTTETVSVPKPKSVEELSKLTRMVSNGEMHTSFPSVNCPREVYVGEKFDYNVYYNSYNGLGNYSADTQEEVRVDIPEGLEIIKAQTTGSFDMETHMWYPPPIINSLATLTLTLKPRYFGRFVLSATLHGVRSTLPYYIYANPRYGTNGIVVNTTAVHLGDRDANMIISIHGDSNHVIEHTWRFGSSDTIFPYNVDEIKVSVDSTNVERIYRTNEGESKTFTIRVIDPNKDYNAVIVMPYNSRSAVQTNHDYLYSVDSSKYYNYDIDVLNPIPNVTKGVGQHFKINKSYWNESYVEYPNGETHQKYSVLPMKGQKFRVNKPDMYFTFEKPFGYIGCVKTQRAHMNPKHDFSNSLLEERYKNRVNMGKKGDIASATSLNITLPKTDWVTIDGLTAMDKPIPIDLIPNWWDGDPLNHRGWAVLSAVKNLQKINDRLYNGDLTVTYLNHDIKTKFNATRQEKVCNKVIDYIMTTTLDNTDSLLDYMRTVNPTIGDYGGYGFGKVSSKNSDSSRYENHLITDRGESIAIRSIDPIGNNANIRFDWMNKLAQHSNYDLKNWKLFVRLRNTSDLSIVFEYMYYNFTHMLSDSEIVNKCDVMIKYLDNGIERVRNYTDVYLNWNNVKAINNTKKIKTQITVGDTTIDKLGESLTALLTDIEGNPLIGKTVKIQLSDVNDNRTKVYTVSTDANGLAKLVIRLEKQDIYLAQIYFDGDDTYEGVSTTINMTVNYTGSTLTYIYASDKTITHLGDYIKPILKDENGTPITGASLNFKAVPRGKGKTIMVNRVTDTNGMASASFWGASGTYDLTISYIGGGTYAPASTTVTLYVKLPITYNINDVVFIDISKTKTKFINRSSELGVYLINKNGNALSGRKLIFTLYNDKNGLNKDYTVTTNSTGYASVPITLNDGIYHAYIHYEGKLTGTPLEMPVSNEVEFTVKGNIKNNTKLIGENLTINQKGTSNYSVTLWDTELDKPVPQKEVRMMFRFKNNLKGARVGYDIKTDDNGVASIPITLSNGLYRLDTVFPKPATVFAMGRKEVLLTADEVPYTDGVDMKYDDCVLTTYLNVNRPKGETNPSETKITAPNNIIIDTANYNLTAKLTSDPTGNNTPIEGASLEFKMNSAYGSKTYTQTTDANGEAKQLIQLANNDSNNPAYSYSVSYKGSELFNPTNTEEYTFTVAIPNSDTGEPQNPTPQSNLTKNETTITSSNYDWFIVLTDNNGNPMTGETVRLNATRLSDNVAKDYYVTTNNKGEAHLLIQLNNGNYRIVASYLGKGSMLGSGSTSTFTINVPKIRTELKCDATETIYYKQGGVTFTLWDMDNNVSLKYKDVVVTGKYADPRMSGKEQYTIRTSQNGEIYLAVNHPVGEYIFTASFDGGDDYQSCTGQTRLSVIKVA